MLIENGLEIHCLSAKPRLEFDVFVQNVLISMYFQCGFVEFGRRVFDVVLGLVRDVVTWNSVISGLSSSLLGLTHLGRDHVFSDPGSGIRDLLT
ncbi:hypothetical protein ACSBR1_040143 [Camellia fascicularis]